MPRSIQRTHLLRCYPTAAQRRRLEDYFGAARWVWNRALGCRTKAYRRRGESVTCVDSSRLWSGAGGAKRAAPNTIATSTRLAISSREACACSADNGQRRPVGQCAWRVTPPGCSRFGPGVVRYPMNRERTPGRRGGMQPPKPREGPTATRISG
ncbi:MAG: helix-turn-helix domain-containing protein [Gemmatimonadetes bacterium]|nr:helix-turn-helix domain-containing protein [Gemmatimonadota bacterium]